MDILMRRGAFALETSSAFSKSKGCRGHTLGSDWLSSYFVRGVEASKTSDENENLQCAISRGNIEREAFKCTTCPGILETSCPPYCPLRASLHRKGRTSKDEVADQSLRSRIRISCKSSLADYRMLACPKAEIVDPLDKAE